MKNDASIFKHKKKIIFMKNNDYDISSYCKKIGVEPRRPVHLMDDYERIELEDQIKIRELELGLTAEEIEIKRREKVEVNDFELFIVALVIGFIFGMIIGHSLWR